MGPVSPGRERRHAVTALAREAADAGTTAAAAVASNRTAPAAPAAIRPFSRSGRRSSPVEVDRTQPNRQRRLAGYRQAGGNRAVGGEADGDRAAGSDVAVVRLVDGGDAGS
jgi:hypothetical protein